MGLVNLKGLSFLLVLLISVFILSFSVSAYDGDVCNETHSPCGGGCTSTDLSYMFNGVIDFDNVVGNVTGWDTSCITNMQGLFGDSDFNQPIGGWNTSSVTTMIGMFYNAPFNQDIGGWDVSQVTNMEAMFSASNESGGFFNQDIGGWVTSSLTDANSMFYNNFVFNQDVSGWDVSGVTDLSYMFNGSLSVANYGALLNGWSSQSVQSGVIFDVGNSQYSVVYQSSKDVLVNNYSWVITDGGSIAVVCVEDWIQQSPLACNGTMSNFTVSYVDNNSCNTTSSLPVNNGSVIPCCVESWSGSFSLCRNGHKTLTYVDAGVCNTSFTLPVNNGSVSSCVEVVEGGGGATPLTSFPNVSKPVEKINGVIGENPNASTSGFVEFLRSIWNFLIFWK